MKRRFWTREELIVAFNLYLKMPFNKINYRHPLIQQLAAVIDRTPSAVAWKLVNFASLDPTLQERKIKGASNSGALDKIIFDEFYSDWNKLIAESEAAYEKLLGNSASNHNDTRGTTATGKDKERLARVRVNQSVFREMILASYDSACCVTGITVSQLLVASHIIPWAIDEKNRLNPSNGLCLNALHDKAFDCGLMTLDESYRVVYSDEIRKLRTNSSIQHFLLDYEGKRITMPHRFLPDCSFLEYHRNHIFRP